MHTINGAALSIVPSNLPSCIVAGKTYYLNFGPGTTYRLEALGIDAANLQTELERWNAEGRKIRLMFTLASAMLGTPGENGIFIPLGFTPEQVADSVNDAKHLSNAVVRLITGKTPEELEELRKKKAAEMDADQTLQTQSATEQIQ